uniref:Uncharacterized protein n=1 Tax=Moniliophthora roreri TaxID=221103 RepID=A0A0W0FK45_MONRR
MTNPNEPGSSTDEPAPNVQPKVEQDNSDAQWAATIATFVVETIDKQNNDTKMFKPNPYEGDHKDTQQFLLNLEVFFRMNTSKYNTDKKKKLLLLSLLKG